MEVNVANIKMMFTIMFVFILFGIGIVAVLYAKGVRKPRHYVAALSLSLAAVFCVAILAFIYEPSTISTITTWAVLSFLSTLIPIVTYFELIEVVQDEAQPSTDIVTAEVQKPKELTTDEKLAKILEHNKRK